MGQQKPYMHTHSDSESVDKGNIGRPKVTIKTDIMVGEGKMELQW